MSNRKSISPGHAARALLRGAGTAVLATRLGGPPLNGWPYASLVLVASDMDGAPLLLLSDLAEHTKNVRRDARASLLIDGTAGRDDPLTGSRVTLLGELDETDDPGLLERFCRRHPSTTIYRDFKDFHLFRLRIEQAHRVAGFGDIHWIDAADLLLPADSSARLIDAEDEIVRHMNKDHRAAVRLIAAQATGTNGTENGEWTMTGVDPEGADFRCAGRFARAVFAKAVGDAQRARAELVRLTKAARGEG
jgi:putative heme iron utilization protein